MRIFVRFKRISSFININPLMKFFLKTTSKKNFYFYVKIFYIIYTHILVKNKYKITKKFYSVWLSTLLELSRVCKILSVLRARVNLSVQFKGLKYNNSWQMIMFRYKVGSLNVNICIFNYISNVIWRYISSKINLYF